MSCCFGELLFLIESPEQVLQVSSGEAPVERHRGLLVAALEADQPPLDLNEIQEVVGGQDLALHDREVDLDLVQPGGMDWQVDQGEVGPCALQSVDRGLATMAGAVVDHPEHPPGRGVRLAGQYPRPPAAQTVPHSP